MTDLEFPWVPAILATGFAGAGAFQLAAGYAFGRHGTYTRANDPATFWFLTISDFVIAAIFVGIFIKQWRENDGEPPDSTNL